MIRLKHLLAEASERDIQRCLDKIKNKQFRFLGQGDNGRVYEIDGEDKVFKITKEQDEYEVADIIVNQYNKFTTFKGIEKFQEKSKLSTWIYRIAYNECIRFLSNESKLKKVELDSNDDNYSRKLYADVYFDAENLSLKFHQILSELTLRQRNIFNMKYFDELKFTEISKITGININTIKSTYYLVEKRIKKEINESAL